jgi:hypothetical protein
MRSICMWLLSPCLATCAFWACFGACVVPSPSAAPQARLIVDWDPTACGDPHRVVLELADMDEPPYSRSAPCTVGALELDAVSYGNYHGRLYAWAIGEPARSVAPVALDVDERVVRWSVDTPR